MPVAQGLQAAMVVIRAVEAGSASAGGGEAQSVAWLRWHQMDRDSLAHFFATIAYRTTVVLRQRLLRSLSVTCKRCSPTASTLEVPR